MPVSELAHLYIMRILTAISLFIPVTITTSVKSLCILFIQMEDNESKINIINCLTKMFGKHRTAPTCLSVDSTSLWDCTGAINVILVKDNPSVGVV